MPHNDSLIFPILSRINQIHPIDTYFLKVHSSIILPPTPSINNKI